MENKQELEVVKFPSENQKVEYKESWRDEYLKWICGFANAQGGTLYIGINDDREVVGVRRSKELLEQIPNMVTMTMGMAVAISMHEHEGLEYIAIEVQSQSMPIAFKGKYYYRTGSVLQELTGIALQDFIFRKMHLTWDAQTIENATMEDIDANAVAYFIKQGIYAKRLPASAANSNIETIFDNLRLIRDGKLTIAALLLFGKDPQKYVPCVRFRIGRFGNSSADLINQDIIEGNLIQMADKVFEVLDNKYLIRPIHYEGMQRVEPLEIPEKGLREIIYNAIVHKDYRGADIQMKIYSDRIRLWNEGALLDGMTIDDLYQEHNSRPRNRLIANVFHYAGFIESWGRGFEMIVSAFQEEGLSLPEIKAEQGGIAVTILRERYQATQCGFVTENDTISDTIELTERQRVIYNYISNHSFNSSKNEPLGEPLGEPLNTTALSLRLNIALATIKRDLRILADKNLIRRIGGRKEGYWEIVKR